MGKLYLYFGLIGIASILAWLGALALLAVAARRPRRTLPCLRAVALAVLGLLLANVNSCRIMNIEVDRTEEYRAAAESQMKQREAEMDYLKQKAAGVRFVEDAALDKYDLAGAKSVEKMSIYERAASGQEAAPSYKKGGKKKRAGAPPETESLETETPPAAMGAADELPVAGRQKARLLPEQDVVLANRWDGFNLVAVRSVLFLAIIALLADYLWRFNRTRDAVLPLPVSGRLVDYLCPKTHSALVSLSGAGAVGVFLREMAHKGEPFIYWGDAGESLGLPAACGRIYLPLRLMLRDLFEALCPAKLRALLPRGRVLTAGGAVCGAGETAGGDSAAGASSVSWRGRLTGLAARAWRPVRRGVVCLLPLPVHRGLPGRGCDFMLESAWFGRSCFVLAPADAPDFSAGLESFLASRLRTAAVAWQTVNVVLDTPVLPPVQTVRRLAWLCRETNFKLIILASGRMSDDLRDAVEEVT